MKKTRAIPCLHQPPTRGDTIVSVAKVILLPLAQPAAFAKGQVMKPKRKKVPLCSFTLNVDNVFTLNVNNVFVKTVINDHSYNVHISFTYVRLLGRAHFLFMF